MIIGQTVFAGSYLSPWFPRQGDSAVFAAEVLARDASATLTVTVQHKNKAEADSAALSAGVTNGINTVSVGTALGTQLKELVRFSYVVSGSNWVHFRVLPPAWRMNGA